jgi:exopolysaccharide biosynthesis polyprenyl glycosylphosphotransferase
MSRRLRLSEGAIDFLTLNLAWSVYYLVRIRSGIVSTTINPDFLVPMLVVWIYWVFVFFVFGLYQRWYAKSRFDEIATLFRATLFGVLLLFFIIFIDDRDVAGPIASRFLILVYWMLIFGFAGGGRILLHTTVRRLLIAGYGTRNTIIVGDGPRAKKLYEDVRHYPALGHRIVGFVPVGADDAAESHMGIPVVGTVANLSEVIVSMEVNDVLIALDSTDHDRLLSVIAACNGQDVGIKIIPDLYDIISGQARTNQIYGFPLIEISPQLMQPWERLVKRTIDIAVSFVVLALGFPVWLLVALAIKLDSRGPVFYTQERVGRDERLFKVIKFRSMGEEAEASSGPVWADREDPRITRVGWLLRRARIDEVPQFINVLDGDMSLVGPRPERPFFVEQLSKEIPLYKRRLKVRPGITGWAQVKHKYDESVDDVRKKVEYDLYYIENMSLRMDFKIFLNTIAVVLLGKGR